MASVALTDTYIRSLKSSGSRIEINDSKCIGLALRVTADGSKSFTFRYRMAGAKDPFRVTIGQYPATSLTEAREIADTYRKQSKQGKNPRASMVERATKSALTFGAVAREFLEKYATPGSWHHSRLKRPIVEWNRRPISTITDDDIALLLEEVAAEAPVGANRMYSALNKMFRWSMQAGRKYVKVNPVATVSKPAKEQPRRRHLSHNEIRRVWHRLDHKEMPCERPIAIALKLILLTMARPGMVTGMLRCELFDLDGPHPEWRLPAERMKNREAFVCPLSRSAVSLIQEALELPVKRNGDAVLPSRFAVRNTIARKALSQSVGTYAAPFIGINPFTPHDLRRTAATIASEHGAEEHWVEAQLHHLRIGVAKVYNQYNMIKEKRRTVAILEDAILNIVNSPATGDDIIDEAVAA